MIEPSKNLVDNAEFVSAVFPDARIFYSEDGIEALVMSGRNRYLVSVYCAADGVSTMSTTLEDWSIGWDA